MNYDIYIMWSAAIYALVTVVKATAKANGFATHPLYVRSLPLLPAVIGATSGYAIGPNLFGWTAVHGAFFGVGAAGVAALSHSVHRQTIKGDDARLDHLRGATKEVDDE